MSKPTIADLTDLLERVEKLEGPSREVDCDIRDLMPPAPPGHFHLPKRFTASIDAAVAFQEAVLPGWTRSMDQQNIDGVMRYDVVVCSPSSEAHVWAIYSPTEPLAIIIATLRAAISELT